MKIYMKKIAAWIGMLWMLFSCCTVSVMAATSDGVTAEELSEKLNSDTVTNEEKTSFLIDYLLSQRSVIMDGIKTILFALFVYVIGRKIVKFCLKLTSKWMKKREVDLGVQNFVMSFARIGYQLVLIFIVAGILGIGATVVAVVGSAGLAIGLALQGSLANLAGGVLILILKPFKVGDYIMADGAEGTVESIDIFYTRVSTSDNKVVVIPNGTITSANITNTTNASKRMIVIDFRVPYNTDVDFIKQILLEMMQQETLLLQEEPMKVVIDQLTPVKMKMQVKAWAKTEEYWDAKYHLTEQLKKTLEENQIFLS